MKTKKAGKAMLLALAIMAALQTNVFAGGAKEEPKEQLTIMVAAAASLRYSYEQELIPLFQKKYPHITVEGTYDSSGKLQSQIEAGLEADVFMSAAPTQMNNLAGKNLVVPASVKPLLENKIVLIKPAGSPTAASDFKSAAGAKTIAIGDPASVPAGQYAREAFTSLGVWDAVLSKASLGTNVTEVLNWVGAASAELGVVYATDAATTNKVEVVAEAPEGSMKQKVIYPAGIVAASKHPQEAQTFIDFLASQEALEVFRKYGFSAAQ
ncbi:MAG: molybdate ABC transporter substrate-binding protein [Spirochaetia bacterium]|jgi:molybdate transport system substrate-binding protein|nr:molybdate ABC transporter substrate-binding protein [Spirochaetia bacterium]